MIVEAFRAAYGRPPDAVAGAPGRIEFIGNHTDYNGGAVLGAAIDRGVRVAVARRPDGARRFRSLQREGEVALAAGDGARRSGPSAWVNYPLGVASVLPGFGLRDPGGFDCLVDSDLAAGAGLSSSAALELASALAFLEVSGQSAPPDAVVRLARKAENEFVGVPCGILDQGVCFFGRKDRLVFIDCRGPSFETVPMPAAAHFWIFNTHTRHALVDGLYAARHAECMAAARGLGVALLADATPASVLAARDRLPPAAFRRARHVVEEIARVQAAIGALRRGDLAAVGRLLTESHRSSRDLFENSTPELDFLAETLAASAGVHGARLTGGGFGGAVMALTGAEFGEAEAEAAAGAYQRRFGARPDVMHLRTADGAKLLQP